MEDAIDLGSIGEICMGSSPFSPTISADKQREHAEVAQWKSIALPRQGSRVRISSSAPFLRGLLLSPLFFEILAEACVVSYGNFCIISGNIGA